MEEGVGALWKGKGSLRGLWGLPWYHYYCYYYYDDDDDHDQYDEMTGVAYFY